MHFTPLRACFIGLWNWNWFQFWAFFSPVLTQTLVLADPRGWDGLSKGRQWSQMHNIMVFMYENNEMNVASQYLVARTLFRCVCMELCHRFFVIFNDFDLYPNITQYCTTWMPPFWISRKILVGKIYSWYFCKYLWQKCYNLSFFFCKECFHMKISFIFLYFTGRRENCPFYWQPWNWVKFQFPIKRIPCLGDWSVKAL